MKKLFKLLVGLVLVLCLLPQTLSAEASGQEEYYSVLFNTNSIPKDFESKITKLGGEIVYSVPEIGYVQIKAPTTAFSAVKGLNGVSAANPSISVGCLPQSLNNDKCIDTVNNKSHP
ncbi:Subtilase family protein OS=Ureibacillus acetophenoni OX=614649 GN=SAMN05877842_105152 PE=3 SV=1 [Ureibacillus acetophenoni]